MPRRRKKNVEDVLDVPKKRRQPFEKTVRDVLKNQELVERLDKEAKKDDKNRRAWDESRTEYVKQYKRKLRAALLDAHVPKRRCPICQVVKLNSRQWVDLDMRTKNVTLELKGTKLEGKRFVCRSCWQVMLAEERREGD